ncbi:hypothetical protein I7I50_11019 [Histoplasma capsulatum G186AR]|uniref:Uncharacterized protein n=1 Tax=Ajellomyces capsulatus TaxID=5037 RepID=A0A8H8D8Y9_AJECA|nr:hypothetical protein I7I52_02258 [Histoplasma capsulatum]QSS69651.1 hypothetical protein I7I50_11019 [Histoplasma capsulatum G186AR]
MCSGLCRCLKQDKRNTMTCEVEFVGLSRQNWLMQAQVADFFAPYWLILPPQVGNWSDQILDF